jgi:hypothetical protein
MNKLIEIRNQEMMCRRNRNVMLLHLPRRVRDHSRRHGMSAIGVPAQPVDATQALNLSAGVSNCKVSRGRSFS